MARRLTKKQRKFTKEYLSNGGNASQAARDTYEVTTDNSAAVQGHRVLKNPRVQAMIDLALQEEELDATTIASIIKQGLIAEKVSFNPETGDHMQTGLPDHLVRHKYLTTFIDLVGAKAPEKKTITVGILDIARIEEVRARLLG